jgi:hypothetical protein
MHLEVMTLCTIQVPGQRQSFKEDSSSDSNSAAYLVRGEINFSYWYSQINEHIYLRINTVANLVQRRKEKGKVCITLQAIDVEKNRDRYMKFYEQLDQHELNKKIKREVQTTLKPPAKVIKFHETIGVPIPRAEVNHFIFRLVCSSVGTYSQSIPFGEAVLTLEEADLCPKENEVFRTKQLVMPPQVRQLWRSCFDITHRPNWIGTGNIDDKLLYYQEEKGEIYLGMNYLPTAQKLTLQVTESKNLRLINTEPHPSGESRCAQLYQRSLSFCRAVRAGGGAEERSV